MKKLNATVVAAIVMALPCLCLADDVKTHTETATSNRREYTIEMGGTMDGVNTRTPIGYGVWSQAFEPNVSLRMENVGETDVVNPWVIVNGKRNWRTMQDIVAEATAGCKTEKERAVAIWLHEINHRFHWTTGDNENNDPVKVLNIFGYTLCGNDAHVISDLWRTAGFKIRRGYPQGHVTAEAFYDGRYHLLDGDESIICLLRDNETIADEAEVVRDHDLMKRTHTYGILAGDDRRTDEFSSSLCVYEGHREGEHRSYGGHTMHFTLRPGEALEWRWDNVGKMYNRWEGYEVKKYIMDRVCNGRMTYTPKLPEAAKQNGTVWKIQSPYVIIGGTIKATLVRPSNDAACKLLLSFDEKQWTEIAAADGPEVEKTIPLDAEIAKPGPARYFYFVKIEATGDAGVKGIAFDTIVQMAPLSLPALEVGKNTVAFVSESTGPQQVRLTHIWRESSASRPPVAPPKPVFPADGASVDRTQFAFQWEEPADPDGNKIVDYHVRLSNRADMLWHLSPNFNKLISKTADKGKAQYTILFRGLLNPGQTYYWRVRACDEKGVWGPWSAVWSFKPGGPGVPVNVRLSRPDPEKRTATLSWQPNPQGSKAVKYKIYGSDEKGFTISDAPYEIVYRSIQGQTNVAGKRDMKEMPANFACETEGTPLAVIGPDLKFPNANKCYYRVAAVDEKGVESGPSDYATIDRPFIHTLPPPAPKAGEKWAYQVKAISSLGDLRCRTFVPGVYSYNAGFWDKDEVRYYLYAAPAWLAIDETTGLIIGSPSEKDAGKHNFLVYADIPKVGCNSQAITLEVKQ
ncbi:MAG: putative Ig domain-containing protein [Planctomycetota bacterium]